MKNNFIFFLLFFHDSCHLLTIYTNEEVVSAVSQSSASIEISTKEVMESSMKLLKIKRILVYKLEEFYDNKRNSYKLFNCFFFFSYIYL